MEKIKLQGIGFVKAKQASELKIGDITVWNFGGTEKITSIIKETKSFLTFKVECKEGAFERKLKKDRMVAFA